MSNKFYVTTPIYYVNSHPHFGHLYTTLIADTIARYKRQRGYDVFFLTGTDEHGQNIERAAEKAGLSVREHVDRNVAKFQEMFPRFNLRYDHWIRTTDDYHKQGVAELWRRARDNGYIYKGSYEGWYCVGCNAFYGEGELKQGEDSAWLCQIHNRPVDRLAEESYFFKLSAFQESLLKLYAEQPDFLRPETRRNEILSFLNSGLNDLSISRVSVKWGIPVPDDPQHTIYVWFDALANYITAVGYGNEERGGAENFQKWWPADVQLMAKDIIRFHCVYWPAFLLAAGAPLPKGIFAHGYWTMGAHKMSKSIGNVVSLDTLSQHFTPDAVRYFCLREVVFGQDASFSYESLIERVNGDLAKGLGNLSSRTLTMIRNYCGGEIPAPAELTAQAAEVRAAVETAIVEFDREFDNYNFSRALEAVWTAIARTDKFISDAAPWKLAKETERRGDLEIVLYTISEALRHFAVVLAPVLPAATQQIWEQLGEAGQVSDIAPATLKWGTRTGARIGEIQPVFPLLDKQKIMAEIEKAAEEKAMQQAIPAAPAEQPALVPAPAPNAPEGVAYIGIEDFAKVELRVGEILTAERVPKADKLLRFTIDLGEAQPRQILAGIAQYYEPEKLIGRKVIVVANLAPRKLRGLESQGMILAAAIGEEGRPVLAGFLEEVPKGAKLR